MAKAKSDMTETTQDVREVDLFKFEEIVLLFSMNGERVARMPFRLDEMCKVMEQENVKFVTVKPSDPTDIRRGIIDMRPKDEIPAVIAEL